MSIQSNSLVLPCPFSLTLSLEAAFGWLWADAGYFEEQPNSVGFFQTDGSRMLDLWEPCLHDAVSISFHDAYKFDHSACEAWV